MGTMPTSGILIGFPQDAGTVSVSVGRHDVNDVNFAVDRRHTGKGCTVNKPLGSQNQAKASNTSSSDEKT